MKGFLIWAVRFMQVEISLNAITYFTMTRDFLIKEDNCGARVSSPHNLSWCNQAMKPRGVISLEQICK
jgi:hypothetical protein